MNIDDRLITADFINLGDFINYSLQGTFNTVINMHAMILVIFMFILHMMKVNTQETAKRTKRHRIRS